MNRLLLLLPLTLLVACTPSPPASQPGQAAVEADPSRGWDRANQDPVATELWEPVPPKVTPGEGSAPPSDAIVLFDGTDFSHWVSAQDSGAVAWTLDSAARCMTVKAGTGAIRTRQGFGSMQLHLEFRPPAEVQGEGQGRGNSGVFLMGRYELQILDSYESRTYSNGQAGSIYKQYAPLVNASRGPGQWQRYDIIFMAPVWGESGRILRPATVTALHNGVLIQNDVALLGPTQYRGQAAYQPHAGELPLRLQDHGNPTSFRNIWVRKL